MECFLRHKIGVCLMITALNWRAVKDTRADFAWHRESNHLVLLSSDHPWWSQGAKLIVCCVQSISIQREATSLAELKSLVHLSFLAREGTMSVQWQFRAWDFKCILFFKVAYRIWLVASVNRVEFPFQMSLCAHYYTADYGTSWWWICNGPDLFQE